MTDNNYDEQLILARNRRARLAETRKRAVQFARQPGLGMQKSQIDVSGVFPPENMNKYMKAAPAEMQGRRPYMEDAVCIQFNFRGKKDECFIGVFDGHGGSDASKLVAKRLPLVFAEKIDKYYEVKKMIKNLQKPKFNPNDLLKKLNAYFTEEFKMDDKSTANSVFVDTKAKITVEYSQEPIDIIQLSEDDAIEALLRESFLEMNDILTQEKISQGTTAAVAYFKGKTCYIGNAGDCRIVLCKNGKARRLTLDHKATEESEKRRIAEVGGWVSNNRVNGVLAVSRAIGDTFLSPMVTADPQTKMFHITDEDQFLIIACDGVWDVISDDLAVELCSKESDPRLASIKLRDHAYNSGSMDNISCVVIKFEEEKKVEEKTEEKKVEEKKVEEKVEEKPEEKIEEKVEENPEEKVETKVEDKTEEEKVEDKTEEKVEGKAEDKVEEIEEYQIITQNEKPIVETTEGAEQKEVKEEVQTEEKEVQELHQSSKLEKTEEPEM